MKAERSRVIFKSPPLTGIMADQYFHLATPSHFWCRRRFEVFQELAGHLLPPGARVAEIGCGNGVVQRQVEDAYNLAAAGFDLHEEALRRNMCRCGEVYCYDIHDRAPEFAGAFDVLLMFDVLEHIEDENRFLDSARFHLARGGSIVLNVPALQWLYSPYDRVQGHHRRYSLTGLAEVARRNRFRMDLATYWGAPLVPVLALRKAALTIGRKQLDNYATGFDSRGEFLNECLYRWSLCEALPQKFAGTSVMAIFATQ
ncbi:MAG TPA: methyltransferase domain-containing protein [Bryobacteraceae bacterium]|nr:methyltransferase domain-containing protein [Bryobacteraceae bacterium]